MRKILPYRYGEIERDEVNQLARENYFALIQQAEEWYEGQLLEVVERMDSREPQVICLAGPSASGKTTTAHTLARLFVSHGHEARVISLDDFYMDRDKCPRTPDGTPDFETIYSLDVELINRCIQQLVQQGRTSTPTFDFQTKVRGERWNDITLGPGQLVILEGLHALNPLLTQLAGRDRVTRVYASARSKFVNGERELIAPKELRLMRRMVRDVASRNTSPESTLAMWEMVCQGERDYIDPFRDQADFKLDTTMDYEPSIFHSYLLPFLEQRGMSPELYHRLEELYRKLDEFFDINDTGAIPADSVIREFIGSRQRS